MMTPKNKKRFVDIAYVHASIKNFLNTYGTRVELYTSQMSANAEMAAYNAVIAAYVEIGYATSVENLIGGGFKYKLQPMGDPNNFSFFRVTKLGEQFDVLNNVALESAHDAKHYYTADIAIVKTGSVGKSGKASAMAFGVARSHFAVANKDIATFLEVKNFQAYPALLFSFSGLLYEIMPEVFSGTGPSGDEHLAPALVCSFSGSGHADYIRTTLEKRWTINIYLDFLRRRRLKRRKREAYKLIGDRTKMSYAMPPGVGTPPI